MSQSDQYTHSSLMLGLNFLLFLLGFAFFYIIEILSTEDISAGFVVFYILVALAIASISFINQSPTGGIVIGISFSSTFWVGFMANQFVLYGINKNQIDAGFYLIYILYATLAFTIIGLFFGFLGYISDKLLVEKPVSESYIYRDYWSNVFSLGKSTRREVNTLDQKLTRIHLTATDWWRQRIKRATENRPELMHVTQARRGKPKRAKGEELKTGDVYDVASGEKLYEDIISPMDLVSAFRPLILNIPATSTRIGGASKLAFEELISRLLGWYINSRLIWLPYIATPALVMYQIHSYYNKISKSADLAPLDAVSVLIFAAIIYFVFIFRNLSQEVYRKRPDVRVLLFTIYIIILPFYGLYYQIIVWVSVTTMNFTQILAQESYETLTPFTIIIAYVVVLTIILTLAYIFVHREGEVANIYLYDAQQNPAKSATNPYKNDTDKPYWLKDQGTLYWVIRYMYYWRYEITLVPHPDWERVEVWVDAKTGDAKWIVSDYHYRELWYKAEANIREKGLYVRILANFHTPIPLATAEEIEAVKNTLRLRSRILLKTLVNGRITLMEPTKTDYRIRHPPNWIEKYGLTGVTADFCSSLNWFYWRYPWGIDNYDKYLSYPSSVPAEQPLS